MSRKWEDLEFDCLVNILGRLGTESLVLDVPFVCKSWYRASLNPSCYQHVDFSGLRRFFLPQNRATDDAFSELMISIVSRGLNKTASLFLETCSCSSHNVLLKLTEERKCPELKSLSIYVDCDDDGLALIKSIGNWKLHEDLKVMTRVCIVDIRELVTEIGQNCKNFNCLAVYFNCIRNEVALVITVHLQKIKKIIIVNCYIEQENLENIISACKDLELLEVSECWYTWNFEERKLRSLGSHIKTLQLDVSYSNWYGAYTDDDEDYSD